MSTVLNTNMFSIYAQRQTGVSQRASEVSMERLSSGERINSAKDDATGRAYAQHHTTQINGYTQSLQNTNNAASMVQVADSAMSSVTEVLQRMRELTLYSVSGAISNVDRNHLQSEFSALQDTIVGLVQDAQFDGIPLLNRPEGQINQNISFQLGGEFSSLVSKREFVGDSFDTEIRGYYEGGSFTGMTGESEIELSSTDAMFLDVDGVGSGAIVIPAATRTADEWAAEFQSTINADANLSSAIPPKSVQVTFDVSSQRFVFVSDDPEAEDPKVKMSADIGAFRIRDSESGESGWQKMVSLEGVNEEDRRITVDVDNQSMKTAILPAASTLVPVEKMYSEMMRQIPGLQITIHSDESTQYLVLSSVNEDVGTISVKGAIDALGIHVHETSQVSMNHYDMDDPENALGALLLDNQSIATQVTAEGMLAKIDSAINFVDEGRAHFAAVENQLQSTAEGMELSRMSSSEARSSLQDADFALESAELARAQIKQQVATAMMAQANQVPQQMLQMFA